MTALSELGINYWAVLVAISQFIQSVHDKILSGRSAVFSTEVQSVMTSESSVVKEKAEKRITRLFKSNQQIALISNLRKGKK